MTYIHLLAGAETFHAQPVVRRIGLADIKDALARGLDDFLAMPSHAVFLCLIYPIVGILLGAMAFGHGLMPLLYPLIAGFALVGPFAAIGLYELSRQREQGLAPDLSNAFDVFHVPSFGAIAALGLLLTAIFVVWLAVAQSLYFATFGYETFTSIGAFARRVVGTPEGWRLIVLGNGLGLLFALLVLTVSVVSFPLLLDRDVGLVEAVKTSCRAVWANPLPMTAWGLIVAAALVLGSLPFLVGLAVVMPVLGHSTWHLYRKVVEPDFGPQPHHTAAPKGRRRYAAQFPASLFAGEDAPKQE